MNACTLKVRGVAWEGGGRPQAQFVLRGDHFVRTPGNIVITPFDDDLVATLILDGIGDVIKLVAQMLDIHLLTGGMGSMDAHHQHVGTCSEQK